MVSMPRRLASSKARSRLPEVPLVDNPTAMSFRPPNAASWRANTTSTPMSLHSAVTTDVSLASPNAGSGGAAPPADKSPGCRNKVASCAASVALPPLPKANSRPPAAKRSAMSRAHRAIRAPSRCAITCRRSPISAILATVDARTSSSTAARSLVSAYRNGYSDSIAAVPLSSVTGLPPHDRDRLARVHHDRVAHASAHQGDADPLGALAGIHVDQV